MEVFLKNKLHPKGSKTYMKVIQVVSFFQTYKSLLQLRNIFLKYMRLNSAFRLNQDYLENHFSVIRYQTDYSNPRHYSSVCQGEGKKQRHRRRRLLSRLSSDADYSFLNALGGVGPEKLVGKLSSDTIPS